MATVELGQVQITISKTATIDLVKQYVSEQTGIPVDELSASMVYGGEGVHIKLSLDSLITNLKTKDIPAFQNKPQVEI